MAWYYLAVKRNDWINMPIGKLQFSIYKPTPEEIKQAITESESIYKSLTNTRLERGMGQFDNSYPSFMKPFYQCIKQH